MWHLRVFNVEGGCPDILLRGIHKRNTAEVLGPTGSPVQPEVQPVLYQNITKQL